MATNGETEESETEKLQAKEKGEPNGVAFVVSMVEDKPGRPRSAPPKRLRDYKKKTFSREELDQKQLEAENRRKEKEQEMLRRVQQARDDVKNLNVNFNALLQQDAKRQRGEGTEAIPDLSPQELKEKFRAVNTDYKKMVGAIGASARLPD